MNKLTEHNDITNPRQYKLYLDRTSSEFSSCKMFTPRKNESVKCARKHAQVTRRIAVMTLPATLPLTILLRVVSPQRGTMLLHGKRSQPETEAEVGAAGGHAARRRQRGRHPREAPRSGTSPGSVEGRERRCQCRSGFGGLGRDPLVAFAFHKMISLRLSRTCECGIWDGSVSHFLLG